MYCFLAAWTKNEKWFSCLPQIALLYLKDYSACENSRLNIFQKSQDYNQYCIVWVAMIKKCYHPTSPLRVNFNILSEWYKTVKLVDDLRVQSNKPWCNYYLLSYLNLFLVIKNRVPHKPVLGDAAGVSHFITGQPSFYFHFYDLVLVSKGSNQSELNYLHCS